ncbi:hotdog fold thioesterase [Solihabitans fulvus]|uniref:Hotdog fold thioesterase n=1 Tax=Solihabitans fulvus TaxID=1892852 RepID=A0A5B2XES8_9PSEU|nr:hotdog fold thioesterase [Solihabitans fulvus]
MVAPDPTEAPGAPDVTGGPDLADEQLMSRMGIEITEWNRDRLVGTMPVAGNRQPYGLLHGGANAVLAESLGSIASAMHAAPDRVALGLELSCTHHRAARDGLVTGVCTPLHTGRSTATFEIVITDEDGRRTCTARLTCVLRERPPGETA